MNLHSFAELYANVFKGDPLIDRTDTLSLDEIDQPKKLLTPPTAGQYDLCIEETVIPVRGMDGYVTGFVYHMIGADHKHYFLRVSLDLFGALTHAEATERPVTSGRHSERVRAHQHERNSAVTYDMRMDRGEYTWEIRRGEDVVEGNALTSCADLLADRITRAVYVYEHGEVFMPQR